jgi:cephalosporin hydroxylase
MIHIDFEHDEVVVDGADGNGRYPIGSADAFSIVSRAWLRSGWDTKYVYSFTWMGRPIIQLPEDLIRIQEVIWSVKPDVIVETGVAHGGSLIYYASLCKAMEKGRVIGIDVEIRPHNRKAIQDHPLSPYITLIDGDSARPDTVERVRSHVRPGETVLVVLDSCHAKNHVLAELRAYAPLISIGSYLVATDGIMEAVVGAPRTHHDWAWNNPRQAAVQFVAENDRFVIQEPAFPFNEGIITERVTYWPNAFVRRVR